ncbi:MAG: 1,4-dihydroxy-2-naphthoate octaprenyltransferase [Thiothrix nivea]|nr:MAG: 1,4-dihydroxy-2-naphthoate octaprenyltransferase [Thiothrix nivea]
MPQEPDQSLQNKPLLRYWLATRPGFMAASVVPVLLGTAAYAHQGGQVSLLLLLLSVIAVMLVHAGMNVLNDYYDELNGTDRLNTQRIFPFTGGSRFIQNDVMSAQETFRFGTALLIAAIVLGIGLSLYSGMALIGIGITGLLLGWGYSAPPLRLNSRGFGEIAVALGFGTLPPLGAWFVQSGTLNGYPVLVSIPVALLVANILIINQFPDRKADKASGKHHWVVRLGAKQAPNLYLAIFTLAAANLLFLLISGQIPLLAMISALPLLAGIKATLLLRQHAAEPEQLETTIKLTIATAVLHGLLLSLILWLA